MEILPKRADHRQWVLGDIYFGYLVPTVLCGRSDAFRRDFCTFLSDWRAAVLVSNIDTFLEAHPDFGLASVGSFFRERRFSKLLSASPKECVSDVWEILWGVWADILRSSVSEGVDGSALLSSVACIYLMFYLYHCQVCTEILAIPLSKETVSHCLDVCAVTLDRFKNCTVFDVFESMLRRHCIRVCLYDGLQYIPQDRVGNPLGMSKKHRESKYMASSVKPPDVDLFSRE